MGSEFQSGAAEIENGGHLSHKIVVTDVSVKNASIQNMKSKNFLFDFLDVQESHRFPVEAACRSKVACF